MAERFQYFLSYSYDEDDPQVRRFRETVREVLAAQGGQETPRLNLLIDPSLWDRISELAAAHPVIDVDPQDVQQAQDRLAALAQGTEEEAEQVADSARGILADDSTKKQLQRLVGGITRDDVKEMSEWVALVIAAYFLFKITDAPLTPEQTAALTNRLTVLAIIVALAAIILSRK